MRPLFQLHRYAGLVFGVFGIIWFATVVPMALFPHPDVPDRAVQLRAYGPPFAPGELESISRVPDRAPGGQPVRTATLHRMDRSLVWRLEPEGSGTVIVDALTGGPRGVLGPDEARRLAERALADRGRARLVEQRGFDFVVSGARTRQGIPPYKVTFNDAAATDVYVNAATGDVERVLGTGERIYRFSRMFHVFRPPLLDTRERVKEVVQFVGLVGVLLVLASGLTYGGWLMARQGLYPRRSGSMTRRVSTRSMVAGSHKWVGIAGFVLFVTWVGSGFIMLLARPSLAPTADEVARMASAPLRADEYAVPIHEAVRGAASAGRRPVLMLRVGRFMDEPVYEAVHADGRVTLVAARTGEILSPLSDSQLAAVAHRFVGADVDIRRIEYLDAYDAYYYAGTPSTRNRRPDIDSLSMQGGIDPPLPVYRVDLAVVRGQTLPSSLYVDVHSGAVHGRIDDEYKLYHWLGRVPHTLDFPWLVARPRYRAAAVAILGTAGTLVAVTGLSLGFSYVLRRFVRRRRDDVSTRPAAGAYVPTR